MEAGRELDTLAAEKVMGWKYRGYGNSGGEWTLDSKKMAFGGYNGGSLPRYSTNIADAWEVVRKMGMVLIENSGEAFGKLDEWNVQFVGHDKEGEPHWVSESAETVELAICLAALKAKEVTGEQHG